MKEMIITNRIEQKHADLNNLVVSINVPKIETVKYINNIDENIFMNINLYDNIGNIINNISYKKLEDKNNVEALNYLNNLINTIGIHNFFVIYNFFINNLNIKIVKGENTFLYANLLSRFLYFYNYNISQYSKIIYIFIFIINHQEIISMLPKIDDQKLKKNYLNFFKTNDSLFNFFNDIFKFVQSYQTDKKKKIDKNIIPLKINNNINISVRDPMKYRLIININVDDYLCEKRIIRPFEIKNGFYVDSELLNELCFSPFKKLYKYLRKIRNNNQIDSVLHVGIDTKLNHDKKDIGTVDKEKKNIYMEKTCVNIETAFKNNDSNVMFDDNINKKNKKK